MLRCKACTTEKRVLKNIKNIFQSFPKCETIQSKESVSPASKNILLLRMLFKDIFKSWRFCHKNYEDFRFKTSCINQYGFMHNCIGNGMIKWKKSYIMHFVLQRDFFRLNKQSYVRGKGTKM